MQVDTHDMQVSQKGGDESPSNTARNAETTLRVQFGLKLIRMHVVEPPCLFDPLTARMPVRVQDVRDLCMTVM